MTRVLTAHSARIVQAVWLGLAVGGIASLVAGFSSEWTTADTLCRTAATCSSNQLDTAAARTLSQHGITVGMYAAYLVAIHLAIVAIFCGLGGLIIWRKPKDRGAILTAFFLSSFLLVLNVSFALILPTLIFFGLLFPDGRFAPRWTRWLAIAAAIAGVATIFSDQPAVFASLAFILPVPFLQIYRFRRLSSWTQRQQAKWALFGIAAFILGLVAFIMTFAVPLPWQTANGSVYSGFATAAFPILIAAIPVSLAISVLRSRLWDIDRIISRALAYTTLSLVLAGLYIGGVIGFQRLFQVFAGGGSPIAIALSTLVIAALFGPLRHRIQVTIDRRFYRAKYDGVRAVTAFAHRLRDEVDLAQLSQDMTSVVRETLQPEHVSLWLRDGNDAGLAVRGGRQ